MKKRILSLVICLSMVAALLPQTVFATTYTDGVLVFEDYGDEVYLIGCDTAAKGQVVIPKEINGKPVREISRDAFLNCRYITGIYIPVNIHNIDPNAFRGCYALEQIDINYGNNYYTVMDGALIRIDGELVRYPQAKADETFTVPEFATTIGNYAFQDTRNLKSVVLHGNIERIGVSAFAGCTKLTDITLPESLCNIGMYAFTNSGIEKITIPSNVGAINDSAFYQCGKLKTVVISEGVQTIGYQAFWQCFALESITIPASVTAIESLAIEANESLIIYGYANTAAETYAADNNIPFAPLDDENTVAQGECGENLTWKLDDAGVLRISGSGAMDDFNSGAPWNSYKISIKSVVVENGVTSIGKLAFESCTNLENVTIPEGITKIGYMAFGNCYKLAEIDLPSSVTYIDARAFYNCIVLASADIGEAVATIEMSAFENCRVLKSLLVPKTVKYIGSRAFSGCSALTLEGYAGSYAETYAKNNGIPFDTVADEPEYQQGDINGDTKLNVRDVVALRRYIAGGYDVTVVESLVDVNGDGRENVRDVVALRNMIAG